MTSWFFNVIEYVVRLQHQPDVCSSSHHHCQRCHVRSARHQEWCIGSWNQIQWRAMLPFPEACKWGRKVLVIACCTHISLGSKKLRKLLQTTSIICMYCIFTVSCNCAGITFIPTLISLSSFCSYEARRNSPFCMTISARRWIHWWPPAWGTSPSDQEPIGGTFPTLRYVSQMDRRQSNCEAWLS